MNHLYDEHDLLLVDVLFSPDLMNIIRLSVFQSVLALVLVELLILNLILILTLFAASVSLINQVRRLNA